MGMFNYVNFEMPCPKCGKTVRGFQTKDGDVSMELVEIEAVITMYSTCECGHWIELSRVPRYSSHSNGWKTKAISRHVTVTRLLFEVGVPSDSSAPRPQDSPPRVRA